MKILIAGCGTIGRRVAEASEGLARIKKVYLCDADHSKAEELASKLSKARSVENVSDVADLVHMAVEAASQEAVLEYLPQLLKQGVSVLTMSVGAFVDDDFRVSMDALALANNAKIYIPSGAIAGLDGLLSLKEAGLRRVHLTTIKPLKTIRETAWVKQNCPLLSEDAQTMVFEGSAAQAVKAFPKSINVAAALSIAGIGFESTTVAFIADPHTKKNTHIIDMEGEAGEIHVECHNIPSPDNPRTSYLAALSAVAAVHRLDWGYRFV